MAHWGWYWKVKKKHVKRVLCSTLPRIDSFALYKGGAKECTIVGFTVQLLQLCKQPSIEDDMDQIKFGSRLEINSEIRMLCSFNTHV